MRPALLALIALMPLTLAPSRALAANPVKALPNGLRTVIVEDHASPVVSLQIWVRCGGVNEEGPTSGVSHFLEHMIFKGTDKISANEISKIVESNGGSINAATASETTHYYIDMPSNKWEEAFDVLSQSVLNPAFPPQEFEKERKVILEEIKRRNDDPQSDLWDGFLEALYTQTPYRQKVIGSVQTITEMTRTLMVDQHRKFYVPNNMVVVVVGDVKRKDVLKKVKQVFGGLPRKDLPPLPNLMEPPAENNAVRTIRRSAKQAYLAIGFVGPSLNDPNQVAMDVMSATLGGGQSSRLYQVLREEKRLVWSVSASFITHAGSGAFGVFAECPPEKVRSLPNDIYFLFHDIEFNGFKPEEVARAKAQLKSSWLYSQETYHGQASQWGFYTTLGAPGMVPNYLKRLAAVSPKSLAALLSEYTIGRPMAGVIVTPGDPSGQ